MKCQYCGAEIENGSAFCTKCGKPVEALAAATERLNEALSNLTPSGESSAEKKPASTNGKEKPKGLLAPVITLLTAAAGWLYVLFSNSIEGIQAWFTSSQDLQGSLSDQYQYYGNNGGSEEWIGGVVFIGILLLFTVIGIVGVVMLVKRLIRNFKK